MSSRENSLTFGPFRLDAATESVWREAEEIRLRPKTFSILRYLAEHPHRLVTKEELLQAMWPGVSVGDAALAVCVAEIRRGLGDDARAPRFIETVHRRGYRFIAAPPHAGGGESAAAAAFVGRERELEQLHRWLTRARGAERQVVFVTGEAGIGKTALLEAFVTGIAAEDVWLARGQCLDHYGAGEAYLPILEALGRLARGPGGDRVVSILGKHAPTWLAQLPSLVAVADLAELQRRVHGTTRERMLREMAEALEALAAERPLVLLLEDLHWSDHSTLDLLANVARRREAARIMVIGTYRPVEVAERNHPLGAVTQDLAVHGAGEELALGVLRDGDVTRYIAGRFGAEVSARLSRPVHQRTDGLPLFMVTVVDALIAECLLSEEDGRWAVKCDDASVQTAVPQGLRQMIEQQLSRLAPDEQRLLEAASVTGLEFSAAALAAALDASVEVVEDRCEALARREQFIRSSNVEEWPDGTVAARYRFLHVLHQQVLYERLPAARRARLHAQIGEREEIAYASNPAERAAMLAVHFEQGREWSRAIRYRRQAGELALHRCAYREAIEHLTLAQALLDSVPDPEERQRLELELQLALGPAVYTLNGAAAPEAEDAYVRARELAERLDDRERLYPALWGLWYVNYGRGRYAEARGMGEQLLALAERGDDTGQLVEAHHALWPTLSGMGNALGALAHVERGLSLYDADLHHAQASLYGGHDPGVCARYHLALTQWLLGYPDRATAAIRDALALADRLAHPLSTIITLGFAAWIECFRGSPEGARANAERLLCLADAHGSVSDTNEAAAVLACVKHHDDPDIAKLDLALTKTQARRRTAWRNVVSFCMLAQAACRAGDVARGLDALSMIPEGSRGAFFAPEILRIRGELALASGKLEDAEQSFRGAIGIATRRAERSLELRAATSLARLLMRTRRRAEARKVLGGIYAWFTEGFDTGDLRSARAVLEELKGAEVSRRG